MGAKRKRGLAARSSPVICIRLVYLERDNLANGGEDSHTPTVHPAPSPVHGSYYINSAVQVRQSSRRRNLFPPTGLIASADNVNIVTMTSALTLDVFQRCVTGRRNFPTVSITKRESETKTSTPPPTSKCLSPFRFGRAARAGCVINASR